MITPVRATHLITVLLAAHLYAPSLRAAPYDSLAYTSPAFTDPGRAERVGATAAAVEAIFKAYADSTHAPGLVYGVVLDGTLVYSGGSGFANLQTSTPAVPTSLFRVASMSKSVTAVAILQLRDAGRLSLDDPAAKYVPEMKQLQYPTTDAPEITIRHLLTHGAGFPEDNPWGDRQLARSDAELRQFIARGISFSNAPGIAFEYSNLGFAILGQIVQAVSGMDFQTYTTENIFKPLGMSATVWEYDRVPKERLALGYDWIDGAYQTLPLEHHGAYGAMGGLITSIEDFAKYVALHLSAWPPRSDGDAGPLKRSSLREMHQPWRVMSLEPDFRYPNGRKCPCVVAYAYGLGWTWDCEGRVYVSHSGGLPGFGSNWRMMPEYGLAVLSFSNKTYESTSRVNLAVLDTIIALAGLEPRALPDSGILEERKRELASLLPDWSGAERSGLFAENFFLDNRLPDLAKRTKDLYEEAGKITRIGPVKPVNQLRGTFTLEGEKKGIRVFFSLTPEKRPLIQSVEMSAVAKGGD